MSQRIDRIIAGLRSTRQRDRDRAYSELSDIDEELTRAEALALVRVAGEPLGPIGDGGDAQYAVLHALYSYGLSEFTPIVREIYPHLRTWDARHDALLILGLLETEEAASTLADLIERDLNEGREVDLASLLVYRMRRPDILLPRLFALDLSQDDADAVRYQLRVALDADEGLALRFRGRLVADSRRLVEHGEPDRQFETVVALGLLGYVGGDEAVLVLERAIESAGDRVALAAALSLVRLGRTVAPAQIDRLASCRETRGALVDGLRDLRKLKLVPRKWRTAPALAEAEMVQWLIAEMGEAPNEIELAEIVGDTYVYRFYDGDRWSAGVAGGGTDEYSGTFSDFQPWDSATPREHAARMAGVLAEWAADS